MNCWTKKKENRINQFDIDEIHRKINDDDDDDNG